MWICSLAVLHDVQCTTVTSCLCPFIPNHIRFFCCCSSAFHFEVSLDSSCPALGCVSVRLCLPSARCLSDTATVSLLLPARGEGGRASTASGFRYGGHRGTTGYEGAKVLCGPIKLKPLVDITGCVVQVRRWGDGEGGGEGGGGGRQLV